jgi:hypothetical protein
VLRFVLFIIFLPAGSYGSLSDAVVRGPVAARAAA